MLELAETVIRLTGSTSRIEHRPLPQDDPQQRRPDIGRARALLDWQPTVALEDGLARTIDYFRALSPLENRAAALYFRLSGWIGCRRAVEGSDEMAGRKALTTIVIGREYQAMWNALYRKSVEAYAEKHGYDLVLIDDHIDPDAEGYRAHPALAEMSYPRAPRPAGV